ncbi:MAG: ion channel [Xanthobacteraceae bacterium]
MRMVEDSNGSPSSLDIFSFAGAGTILLIALVAFIGLYPLLLGEIAGRIAGGLILSVIFVTGAVTASNSTVHRSISVALAILALGLQAAWLSTHNKTIDTVFIAVFAAFCLYTALVILRRVLASGPVLAEMVHAALSVYILLALFWAAAYVLIETISPGAFSLGVVTTGAPVQLTGAYLFADMLHLSIATLTSTGYGDITPVAPFARSVSQLEQLMGVFYIAVLISRLIGLYESQPRS